MMLLATGVPKDDPCDDWSGSPIPSTPTDKPVSPAKCNPWGTH